MSDTTFLNLRDEIMAQHRQLRDLLQTLEAQAAKAVRPGTCVPADRPAR
jgi:hypothetical protein